MNNSILYILILLGIGLASCSNNEDAISKVQIQQHLVAIKRSTFSNSKEEAFKKLENYPDSIAMQPCRFYIHRWTTTKKLPLKATIISSNGEEVWCEFFKDGALRFNSHQFDRGVYKVIFSDTNGPIMMEKFIAN